MNYGTDRSEVICRTYVRKTLISEKVAYNLEDAKQVLDCAESLHPCRGAGRAKDFTYDVLTKKLEQQISHSDGLVFSVTCKGAVKQQDFLSIGENTFMFRANVCMDTYRRHEEKSLLHFRRNVLVAATRERIFFKPIDVCDVMERRTGLFWCSPCITELQSSMLS
ncbi:hypothetical protein MRX96_057581 [Rhipicephalus microplus]